MKVVNGFNLGVKLMKFNKLLLVITSLLALSACSLKGPAGPKGDQGEIGLTGPSGATGATGPQGPKGETGATGATGPQGSKGDKGDPGETGPQGEKGDKGDTGATGSQGPQGEKGDKGDAGDTPYIGSNGNWWIGDTDTGIKAQGDKGETGATGAQGETGQPGKDGTSCRTGNGVPSNTLGINGDSYIDLTTWDYYVKENGIWVLKGNIKGDKGDKGDVGQTGATGPQGPTGPSGSGEVKQKFTVTFNSDGGTAVASQQVEEGKKIVRPTDPTKQYYDFDGWYHTSGEKWSFIGYVVTEDITLVAHWVPTKYSITYNLNGGSVMGELPSFYTYFEDVSLTQPDKYNCSFMYWQVEGTGEIIYGIIYAQTFSKNLVLNAIYNGPFYVVSVFSQDETLGTVSGTCANIEGTMVTVTATPGIGIDFTGWYVDDVLVSTEAIYTFPIPDHNITLIAHFEFLQYVEVLSSNTSMGTVTGGGYYSLLETFTVVATPLPGYIFSHWTLNGIRQEGIEPQRTFQAMAPMTIVAHFIPDPALIYTYVVKEGYARITKYNGSEKDVSVPTRIGNYETRIIGQSAFEGATMSSISIPNTIVFIEDYAFAGANSLVSVEMTDSVYDMGKWTFTGCDQLNVVYISSHIEKIGEYTFNSCDKLQFVTLNDGLKTIGEGAFFGCSGLNYLRIPSTVTKIEANAFRGCNNLTLYTSKAPGTIEGWNTLDCPIVWNSNL